MDSISWPGGSWEATLRLILVVGGIYVAAMWATLVFWAYRDIRQRTRDPIIQTVAILLVLFFFLPGHWIYLILRPRYTLTELYERSLEEEALLQELEDQKSCPTCKRRVYEEYLICPSCRTQLKEPCRSCAKPLSYAWMACPFCGLEKPPREVFPVRAARPALPGASPSNGRETRPAQRPSPPTPVAAQPPPARASTRPANTVTRQRTPAQPQAEQRRDPFEPQKTHDPFAPAKREQPPPKAQADDGVIDATLGPEPERS